MGRKTFDSIGRALPGRTSVVITRQTDYAAPEGVRIVHSIDAALDLAAAEQQQELFIVGGGEVYRQTLPRADRIYLTQVHANVDGDAYFPEISADQWRIVDQQHRDADEKNQFDCDYLIYDRIETIASGE